MTEPCKRHKADKTVEPLFRAVATDDKRYWYIAVWHRCARCGEQMSGRILRDSCKPGLSEVLDGYGLSVADKRAYLEQHHPHAVALQEMNRKAATPKPARTKRTEHPLTSWPFHTSAHVENHEVPIRRRNRPNRARAG